MVYRDGLPVCPRCRAELSAGACARCRGSWVALHDVEAKWRKVALRLPLPPMNRRIDREPSLPCAVCGSPMKKVMLEAIALDRCDSHGVWFDFGELDRLKSTAQLGRPIASPPAEPSPSRSPPPPPRKPRATLAGRRQAVAFLEESLKRKPESFHLTVRLASVLVSMLELVEPREAKMLAQRAVELFERFEPSGTLDPRHLEALQRARSLLDT